MIVTDGVKDIESVTAWLDIPNSKKREVKIHYGRDRNRAYLNIFLQEHPSPSWTVVGYALWKTRELGPLQLLQSLYLKGKP